MGRTKKYGKKYGKKISKKIRRKIRQKIRRKIFRKNVRRGRVSRKLGGWKMRRGLGKRSRRRRGGAGARKYICTINKDARGEVVKKLVSWLSLSNYIALSAAAKLYNSDINLNMEFSLNAPRYFKLSWGKDEIFNEKIDDNNNIEVISNKYFDNYEGGILTKLDESNVIIDRIPTNTEVGISAVKDRANILPKIINIKTVFNGNDNKFEIIVQFKDKLESLTIPFTVIEVTTGEVTTGEVAAAANLDSRCKTEPGEELTIGWLQGADGKRDRCYAHHNMLDDNNYLLDEVPIPKLDRTSCKLNDDDKHLVEWADDYEKYCENGPVKGDEDSSVDPNSDLTGVNSNVNIQTMLNKSIYEKGMFGPAQSRSSMTNRTCDPPGPCRGKGKMVNIRDINDAMQNKCITEKNYNELINWAEKYQNLKQTCKSTKNIRFSRLRSGLRRFPRIFTRKRMS